MIYKYLLTQRAPSPGAQPNTPINVEDFGTRILMINDRTGEKQLGWGTASYNRRLTKKEVEDYEMILWEV